MTSEQVCLNPTERLWDQLGQLISERQTTTAGQFVKPTGSALLLIPRMHFTYKWKTMWKRNKQAF